MMRLIVHERNSKTGDRNSMLSHTTTTLALVALCASGAAGAHLQGN